MNKNIIVSVLALVLVVGGYFYYKNSYQAAPPIYQQIVDTTTTADISSTVEKNVITLTDNGYVPAALTIKKGETVVFKNASSATSWPASAMHPSHVVYSGTSLSEHCPDTANTSFDACKGYLPGQSWSFTFDKVGTWKYHNHLNARQYGSITVE